MRVWHGVLHLEMKSKKNDPIGSCNSVSVAGFEIVKYVKVPLC